jgi:hypothetical protein
VRGVDNSNDNNLAFFILWFVVLCYWLYYWLVKKDPALLRAEKTCTSAHSRI